jgi:hypothetical protein
VRGRDDGLMKVAPLLELATPWRGFLGRAIPEEDIKLLHAHERTGRPLGTRSFSRRLKETLAGSSDAKSPGLSHGPRKGSDAKPGIENGVPGTQEWCPRNPKGSDAKPGIEYGVPGSQYGVPGTPEPPELSMVSPEPSMVSPEPVVSPEPGMCDAGMAAIRPAAPA